MAGASLPFWHIHRHPCIYGIIIGAFAFSQGAAMMSFDAQAPLHNILGLFGHISAYIWWMLFGPVSALGILGLAALSYDLLKGNSTFCTRKHLLSAFGILASLAMLATLLAILYPPLEHLWTSFLHVSPIQAPLFRLGGFPAAFIYRHIPYLSFEKLFNIVGTALLSSTALFICLVLLFDLDIKMLWRTSEQKSPKDIDRGLNW